MNDARLSSPLASSINASPDGTLGVSVIIPAHNATATLEATLNSVVHQIYGVWEAIIIDDGSTDETCTTAKDWADRHRGFRVLHQQRLGVSAARNRGLREARYPFVLFLDGDDRLAPMHLELMVGALTANSTLDAVHCGWQRILPSGATGRPHLGSDAADLFQHFASDCHFAIHACVLRRSLALAVGGFDTSLTTCEVWDFFQRIACTGARFGRVSEVLAFHHIRADSARRDSRRCLIEARVVMDRGHRREPCMRAVAGARTGGLIPTCRDFALYNFIIYCAAQEIGAGREGLDLLDIEDLPPVPELSAVLVADGILESLPIGADRSEEDWPRLWDRVSAPLAAFLGKLEAHARAPALAFAVLRHLERSIVLADSDDGPLVLGSTYRLNLDLARPVRDVFLPPKVDRLICRLSLKSEPIGVVELVGTGMLAGWRIAEAASEGRWGLLLRRALTPLGRLRLGLKMVSGLLRRRTLRLLYAVLAAKRKDKSGAARRLKQEVVNMVKTNLPRVLATRPGRAAGESEQQWRDRLESAAVAGRVHARERVGTSQSADAWDWVFALPEAYESDYQAVRYSQTLALLPEGVFANALEIVGAEGHFTIRLAPREGNLTAVDISIGALPRTQERCAGQGNVAFQRLHLNRNDVPGPFDLIVCSEVLYYVRNLRDVVARVLFQVRPGGCFLTFHSRLLADEPEGTCLTLNNTFGAETEPIANAIAAQPGVTLRRELRTRLYRVLLYQRLGSGHQPNPPEIAKSDCKGRMTPTAEEPARSRAYVPVRLAGERTCCVPILMYHQIAAEGPPGLERFRVAPDLFAAQMAAVHRAGYRAIGLEDWFTAMAQDQPLSGKPFILTFDDGYQDFLTAAMPVLCIHGFSATVFLVAERIGGTSDWDAGYGATAPLLSWEEVRALQEAGIEFGCHTCLHRPMTGMPLGELAEDTVRARAILEEGLASPVATLAYPYGAQNEFVRRVIADLGFRTAVSCEPGISRLGDDPLRLRRVEVTGECTPEQLVAKLGVGITLDSTFEEIEETVIRQIDQYHASENAPTSTDRSASE